MRKGSKLCIFFMASILCLSPQVSLAAQPIYGGSLNFGISSVPETLDPHQVLDKHSLNICGALYETLVKFSVDDSKLLPALATSWEAKNQGREWIFHLREGVMFHDGTTFNADAVVFSFERQLKPDHPYYENKCFYGRYLFGKVIESIQVIDEYTVRFVLKHPYTPFVYSLTAPAAMIVSPEAVKEYKENFYLHPTGTGPFKLLRWEESGKVILERSKDYRGEKAYLDRLVFFPVTNQALRIEALARGELQGIELQSPAGIKSVTTLISQAKVVEIPNLDVVYLALNMKKAPLDQLKVREALARVVNREEIQQMFYLDRATEARSLIPPFLWGYNPDLIGYEFDPQEAGRLLEETKVEIPSLNLWIPESPSSYLPDPEEIAQKIADYLAKVGIEVKIVKRDWRGYLEGCEKGEHDIALAGWRADFPDPDSFLYPLLDQQVISESNNTNWSFYRNSFFHEILQRARQVTDRMERTRLYQVAQKIVQRDVPCIPLVHTREVAVFSPEVKGVRTGLAGEVYFERAWVPVD